MSLVPEHTRTDQHQRRETEERLKREGRRGYCREEMSVDQALGVAELWVWAPGLQRPDKGEEALRTVETSGKTTWTSVHFQGLSDFFFSESSSHVLGVKAPSLLHPTLSTRGFTGVFTNQY